MGTQKGNQKEKGAQSKRNMRKERKRKRKNE
jgi:hypothetical protein